MNPAQQLVEASLKAICDEVAKELGDLDFHDPKHWLEAFDIASRYIRWKLYQCVANGEWAAAGIESNLQVLKDLRVYVYRTTDSVRMNVQMPTVMKILREQDDPNVN